MNNRSFVPEYETEEMHQYCSGCRIITRVVGVTFNGRQEVIAQLKYGEQVYLKREPKNPYDRNAIRVERHNSNQIGYLNRYLASTLAPLFDNHNKTVIAQVHCLSGNLHLGYSLGVVIAFHVP